MMKITYILSFISLILIDCHSQSVINNKSQISFDTIMFESEKNQIIDFLYSFMRCNDSIEIQKIIYFPFFTARDPDDPLDGSFRLINNTELNDSEINSLWSKSISKDPLKLERLKFNCSEKYRQELKEKDISYCEDFFSNQANRTKYCAWLIKAYNFPTKFKKEELISQEYRIFTRDYLEYETEKISNITTVQICNFGIIKINGAYKISYASFIWN